MRIRISHACVLTLDDAWHVYPDGYVTVEDDRIIDCGEGRGDGSADREIDGRGGILMPGMVNLHCHAAMVPFRTMGDDCPDRLRRFLFPLENSAMTEELVYLSSLYGIAEMLRSGTTTFVDMYYFEEQVARAAEESGIRAYLGETVISQKSPDAENAGEGLARCARFLQDWAGHDRVRGIVAPHGTTTVSPQALQAAHQLAREYDTILTLHASEMDYEMDAFREKGTTPIRFLDELGIVDERLLAAHCIHLTPDDIAVLAARGASVVHCPGSNLKAGKGIAPVRELAEAGVPVGLGTDGPSSGNTLSLFDTMRLFPIAQKTRYHDRRLFPAREVVYAATRGGARALHADALCGSLETGKKADLVLVSTEGLSLFPMYNPYSALVYGAGSADVDLVMADGRIVVENGRLTGISLTELKSDLQRAMRPFSEAAEKYRNMI
ncbi:MAG: amidohydrolase [Clostridia bacterium]|nr:amidohydrolase [Clostridia bacterium]